MTTTLKNYDVKMTALASAFEYRGLGDVARRDRPTDRGHQRPAMTMLTPQLTGSNIRTLQPELYA